MKCEVKPSVMQLKGRELRKLLVQVQETLATEFVEEKQQTSFGPADLWKLRRTMKTAARLGRRPRILPLA